MKVGKECSWLFSVSTSLYLFNMWEKTILNLFVSQKEMNIDTELMFH